MSTNSSSPVWTSTVLSVTSCVKFSSLYICIVKASEKSVISRTSYFRIMSESLEISFGWELTTNFSPLTRTVELYLRRILQNIINMNYSTLIGNAEFALRWRLDRNLNLNLSSFDQYFYFDRLSQTVLKYILVKLNIWILII